MNGAIPMYLTVDVWGGSLVAIGGLLIAVRRGTTAAGWTERERGSAFGSVAALLAAWFAASFIPAWLGFYHGPAGQIPKVQYGLLVPMLAVLVWFWRGKLLRRVVDAVPQRWLTGVQVYRVLGLTFLVLYALKKMPGEFAWPAGVGDTAVGLLAIPVGLMYVRGSRAGWLRAWNLLGLADLAVAVTMGVLTSPSPIQRFAFDRPNEWISAFPLVLIPVFLVPLSVLLHLASLWKLQRTEAVGERGAMRGREGMKPKGCEVI